MSGPPIDPAAATPASGAAPGSPLSRTINLLMLVVGGLALWFMLRRVGWATLQVALVDVGAWFALILVLDLAALGCDAAALHAFMRPEARMIRYPRVLGAQAAGRAINVLTPGGALGEVVKLTLLDDHVPRARALSSIVLLNLASTYLSVAIMLIGVPITLLAVELPPAVATAVEVALAVLVPALVGLAVLVQRGALATTLTTLGRLRIIGPARVASWSERVTEVDRHLRELVRQRSAGTWRGLAWLVGARVLGWSATTVLIVAAGVTPSPLLLTGVFSVGVLIAWVAAIVPLGLGLADGGNYALYSVLGATGPHGLVITMLSRARTVTIAGLGLLVLAGRDVEARLRLRRVRRKLADLRGQRRG